MEENSVTDFGITPEELRRLARLVDENGLSELRVEQGDLRVTLRSAAYFAGQPASVSTNVDTPLQPLELSESSLNYSPSESTTAPEPLLPTVRVEAPVMGVFYRAAAEGEPPLVEEGDTVETGQAVGLIEAMKVFSEVISETSGRVREIPAKNGALVQPGDTLVVLEAIEA